MSGMRTHMYSSTRTHIYSSTTVRGHIVASVAQRTAPNDGGEKEKRYEKKK